MPQLTLETILRFQSRTETNFFQVKDILYALSTQHPKGFYKSSATSLIKEMFGNITGRSFGKMNDLYPALARDGLLYEGVGYLDRVRYIIKPFHHPLMDIGKTEDARQDWQRLVAAYRRFKGWRYGSYSSRKESFYGPAQESFALKILNNAKFMGFMKQLKAGSQEKYQASGGGYIDRLAGKMLLT